MNLEVGVRFPSDTLMFKYTTVSMEDLAEDIGDFSYAMLTNILPVCEKFRPVIDSMTLEEKRELSKMFKETILERLKAYEG